MSDLGLHRPSTSAVTSVVRRLGDSVDLDEARKQKSNGDAEAEDDRAEDEEKGHLSSLGEKVCRSHLGHL